jgi:hypothetical protein
MLGELLPDFCGFSLFVREAPERQWKRGISGLSGGLAGPAAHMREPARIEASTSVTSGLCAIER